MEYKEVTEKLSAVLTLFIKKWVLVFWKVYMKNVCL